MQKMANPLQASLTKRANSARLSRRIFTSEGLASTAIEEIAVLETNGSAQRLRVLSS
jgi:hypothetical protein